MVSGPLADHAPVPAPFWRVTASGFDGFGSGHSDIEFKGQCAIRKETQWLPWCFALNSVRQPHYLLTWKNEFLWTLVFRIKLYSLYSPSGISCQAKNHRTDISKRKLNVIFLIVYFSFLFIFPPFLLEKPDGKKGRSLSLTLVPFGSRGRTVLAVAPLVCWLEVMMGLSRFRG